MAHIILQARVEALQLEIQRHRHRRERAFAEAVAPKLHTLASRQAWGEVKRAMGKGKSGSTLRDQAEVKNLAGDVTNDVQAAAHEAAAGECCTKWLDGPDRHGYTRYI